jgi:hypothetical protein
VMMSPRSPSVDQLMRWITAAFEALDNQKRMGTRLPSLLRSVGMEPQPPYELTGRLGEKALARLPGIGDREVTLGNAASTSQHPARVTLVPVRHPAQKAPNGNNARN